MDGESGRSRLPHTSHRLQRQASQLCRSPDVHCFPQSRTLLRHQIYPRLRLPATPEITDTIVANIAGASDAPAKGSHNDKISSFDPKPEYLKFLYTLIDVERIRSAKLKVKYDALYSTSRGYLDGVLEHCGCDVESFHTYRDVLFGGGMPEPKGEQLVELVEAVKNDAADLGLATDGDSDRFGIVDELGNVLTPNTVLLLLARHLVKNKGLTGAIVRTVATTHLLDNLAAKYGLTIYETAVGFKYIGEKMRETEVLIGGEESGGLSVLGHIPEKDGILADMLVAEAIAYEGKPLSQLVEEAIKEADGPLYNKRLDLHLEEAHKAAVLESFTKNPPTEVAGIGVKEICRKDGIKLYLEDGGWVLLRQFRNRTPDARLHGNKFCGKRNSSCPIHGKGNFPVRTCLNCNIPRYLTP